MSPTCSKSDFAGRNALSATDLTNFSPPGPIQPPKLRRRTAPRTAQAAHVEEYVIDPPIATPNRALVPGW
jgi:hypothetical protein